MSRLQPRKKLLSPKQRVVVLILVFVVVLGLLLATVFRDNVSSLFRHVVYSQSKSTFSHNAQANSLFMGVEDDLLVCTRSQVQLFSPTGNLHVRDTVSMANPALNVAGKHAVVYDVGGQALRVISDRELAFSLNMAAEEAILCATVNEKGWLAVTTKTGGYKAVVTVYDSSYEPVLAIRLSSRYISDAVVTPDCHGVYLISPGQSEGTFSNTLLYYTFSSRERPTREVSLGSNVILDILSGGKCWILGDQSLLVLDSSGVITAKYDYGGRYLRMGSLHGNGFAALYLSLSSSGSAGTLTTVGSDGEVIGELSLADGQVLALGAQGNDLALLTTGDIITSGRKLTSYRMEPNQQGIRNLAVYRDGGIALISSSLVNLYFPSGEQIDNVPEEEGKA